MDGGHDLAASRRLASLAEKFHDKQYRDSYVASHNRGVLSQQMRNFRGDRSQAEYAENVGKQKTVIGRLESPAYAGWSVRTMLEIARKEDVAVIVRFVDFPTFLRFTGDLSEQALRPASYNQDEIHDLADDVARLSQENALKGLFSSARLEQDGGRSAREALPPPTSNLPANDEVQPTHRFGIMPR